MRWICSSHQCAYEEQVIVAHYCPWCGQDMLALCSECHQALRLSQTQCSRCSQHKISSRNASEKKLVAPAKRS